MPLKKPILIAGAVTVLLLSVLIAIALFPQSDAPSHEPEQPTIQVMFDINHVDHLEHFSYQYKEKDRISVSRTQDGWQITDHPGLPLNSVEVSLMLRRYEQILALRTVTETLSDPAEYGFDTPSLVVTLGDHGSEKTYLFGDENTAYEGYYCMIKGSDTVYLLDVAYFTAFETPMEKLLCSQRLPDLSKITALTWTSSTGVLPNDTVAIRSVLSTLKIDRLIDFGTEKYPSYGLDSPAVGVITLSDGTSLSLRFANGETDELIYLTIGDEEIIYLASCEEMNTLRSYIALSNTNG